MPLAVHNLSFAYAPGKPILRDLSLSFSPGVTAILGPNGAGKSTLLRLLLALRTPAAGRVTLDDRAVADIPRHERAARLAYIPQSSSVAFPFSVRQIVRTGLFAASSTSAAHARAADDALRRLDLLDLADEPFGLLSAGQQQRVTVARALVQLGGGTPLRGVLAPDQTSGAILGVPAAPASSPVPPNSPSLRGQVGAPHHHSRALLADEPISAMDPRHALQTLSLFRDLARTGVIVILILHDLPTALAFADHAVLLTADGDLAAAGPARQTLTPDALQHVFSVPFERFRSESGLTVALLPADPSTLQPTPAGSSS